MNVDLTIGNYRCFSRESPARLELRSGFTALVGANNAGKSTVIRFFFELRGLFNVLAGRNSSFQAGAMGLRYQFNVQLTDPVQMFSDANEDNMSIRIELPDQPADTQWPAVNEARITVYRDTAGRQPSVVDYGLELRAHHDVIRPASWSTDGQPLNEDGSPAGDVRPLRACFADLARCFCIGPFRTAQPIGMGMDLDAQIGSSLIQKWKQQKQGLVVERKLAREVTEALRSAFGLQEFNIEAADLSGPRLIAQVDGQSYALDELGSGLSHFVVASVNLATVPKPSWVLVDEPENALHPSLQLEFLSMLARFSTEGVIFATHSYGLARRVSSQIYLVERDAATRRSTLKSPQAVDSLAEFLGELGYSGYRDLGFDKILLVEGPTDVPTVLALIRLLGSRRNVIVLPLGGSSLINPGAEPYLCEVKRLGDDVAAVIDSERPARAAPLGVDRRGFVEACKKAGVLCHVLERRTIENYFTDPAVKAGLGADFRALHQYEATPPGWRKPDNWRVASQMAREPFASTDLGRFLLGL